MAMRRIAVEEAFVTPEIMSQWQVVLASRDVEPGFAKMGESILASPALVEGRWYIRTDQSLVAIGGRDA